MKKQAALKQLWSQARNPLPLFSLLLALITGCEGGIGESFIAGSSSPNLIFSPYNSELQISSSKIAVGGSSTVSFVLRDISFHPVVVPGTHVYFYYSGGSSMGFFDSVQDHGNGTYTTNFKALSSGSANTIHVRVNDQEVTSSFGMPALSVMGGTPATIIPISGNQQTAPGTSQLPLPFFVLVRDASDTPLSGALIDWKITSMSGGLLSFTSITSDANGLASSQLTLGISSGAYTVSATARGTDITTAFTATSVSTPFTYTWPMNATNASQFDYDSTKIDFNGLNNSCELASHSQIDQDNSAAGFGGATLSGLLWDSTKNVVRMDLSQLTQVELGTSNWTPKAANLIAAWHLNDASGSNTVADTAGTNTGIATNARQGASGKVSSGVTFNGSSSRLDMGTGFNFTSAPFSFSYWINLSSYSTNSSYNPIPIYKGSYNSNGYYNQINPDGSMSFNTNQSGSIQSTGTAGGAFSLGVWHHVAITRAGPSVRIYLDGVDATAGAGVHNDPAPSNDHFYLGYYPPVPIYMDGSMDEVGVWSTTLTSADVAAIYQRQKNGFTGTLTSRVFDGFSTAANWTSLAWTSTLPFLKELTDYAAGSVQNETSTDYSALVGSNGAVGDNNLMSGIVGLWHLNEPSYTSAAGEVKDTSGNGNHGTTSVGVTTTAGRFGGGASFNGVVSSTDDAISFGDFAGANFGLSDFTLSTWVKTVATNTQIILGKRPVCNHASFWNLYLTNGVPNMELDGDSGGTNYRTFSANRKVNDGLWHHLMFVRNQSTLTLYSDGEVIGSSTSGIANLSSTASLNINGSPCGSYGNVLKGQLDEVGIWSRALKPLEIVQLYRRGSNRIKFQVRNCTTADCSDDTANANWKGQNGTAQTYFSELNNTSLPNGVGGNVKRIAPLLSFASFTSPPATSRYFQYRAVFESDDTSGNCNYGSGPTACSPELKIVSIGPNRNFDSSSPAIITKTGVNYLALGGFAETLGTACAQGTSYNLGVGTASTSALWYFWDAVKGADCASVGTGAWCLSNGTPAQTSPAAVISAHAAALANKAGVGKLFVKTYLNSDGLSACQLQKIDISGQQ